MHILGKRTQILVITGVFVIVFVMLTAVAGCSHGKKNTFSRGHEPSMAPNIMDESGVIEEPLDYEAVIDEELLYDEAQRSGALQTIYFSFDDHSLRPDAKGSLDQTAQWLSKNANTQIIIEGHCDEWGTNEYNLALGYRRAAVARDYLISLGIAPELITTLSYGEERPADPGHHENAWAKNRRDDFRVTK